jgi:Type IV secretion system pilin
MMKRFVIGVCLVALIGVPFLAHAQISLSIPGTNQTSQSTSPVGFIDNFYQFALAIGGLLAFGAIVYGGIKYLTSAGNPSSQSEGKEWIYSALLGLLLLAGAYLILDTINPALVTLSLPVLGGVNIPPVISGGGGGGGGSGVAGARCQPPQNGPCSAAALQGTCMGSNAATAAGVCNVESNGSTIAGGDKSTSGQPASVGLFQINLSANPIAGLNCPSAFSNPYTGSNPHTTITNQSLYQQCVAAAEDVNTNINYACQLSKGGTTWKMWGPSTLQACGL